MRKSIKFMPFALGLLTLASCSEELDFVNNEVVKPEDGQVFATIEAPQDAESALTRTGYGEFTVGKLPVWTKGDAFKLYAAQNWKTDIYTLEDASAGNATGTFTPAVNPANINLGDGGFAVYPTTNVTVDEGRTKLSVTLTETIEYKKIKDAKCNEETATAYQSVIPMWGFANNKDGKKFGNGGVSFKPLTAILRVVVESALPTNAKYILVRSESDEDALSGDFTADIEEIAEEYYNNPTGGKEYAVPALKGVTDKTKNWIIADLTNATDYDNNIYIPIPAGKMAGALKVYLLSSEFEATSYSGTEITSSTTGAMTATFTPNDTKVQGDISKGAPLRTYVANKDYKRNTIYTVGTIKGNATLTSSAKTLIEVNDYLKGLDVDRDMVINFTNPIPSFVKTVWGAKMEANTLVIPASWDGDYNVNLNFNGATHSLNTSEDVADLDGVALTGSTDLKPIEISNKSSITSVTINANSIADGKAVTVEVKESANSKTILGKNITTATITAGNVGFGSGTATSYTVTDNGAVSIDVNEGATIGTLAPKGGIPVTVNGGTVTKLQLGAKQVTLTQNGGTIAEIALGESDLNVTMTGGEVTKISIPSEDLTAEHNVKFTTSGAAVIAPVGAANVKNFTGDGAKKYIYTFNATWDDETTAATTPTADIYTAAQLRAVGSKDATSINLNADITIAATATYTALSLHNSTTTFNGNKKTITGLTGALFSTLGAVTVKDLTLANSTINASNTGAVAASVTAGATLNNVNVTNATIGQGWTVADSNSKNVGGLVGQFAPSSATLTITNCSVTGTVQGYYGLGGFIGEVAGTSPEVSITTSAEASKSNVALKKTYWKSDATDSNCGKVGNFIGTISSNTTAITIGANEQTFANFFSTNNITATNIATATYEQASNGWLEFARNVNASSKAYVGMSEDNYMIGFSSATALGTVTLFGATTKEVGDDTVTYDINYVNKY